MPEWKDRKAFESPKGRVVDHVGFSVAIWPTLCRSFARRASVTEAKSKNAFIEGPDKIRIELVEEQAWGGDHVGKSLPEHVHGGRVPVPIATISGRAGKRTRTASACASAKTRRTW